MDKEEINKKFKNFDKEYKVLDRKILGEFGEENAFEEQYSQFRDTYLDLIIKDDSNLYYLSQNMDIILLNMYTYICEKKLGVFRKAHSSFWYNFIDDSTFKIKYQEISNKINEIAPKDLKKRFNEYGKSVLLEFDNGFAIFIAKKVGLQFKMPKSFFKEQLESDSEDLEITFTPNETMKIFDMWLYWEFGDEFRDALKEKGWKSD